MIWGKIGVFVILSTFVILGRIGIGSIRTSIPTVILNKTTNKRLMIMTILKGNCYFLTDKMIYIMRTRK